MEELFYPIGNQSFEKIREGRMVYVDKTEQIFRLTKEENYIFLSRPRRFGKSLLLSTIKAYFEGKKDLFQGLAIEKLENEWRQYPVLHLSFANFDAGNEDSLMNILDYQFEIWEKEYNIKENNRAYAQRFQYIIKRVYEQSGSKVVVLIDEYDHPLINTIENEEIHNRNKELLKSVYSNLKDMDSHIRFGMLTGVTRFSKAGIFSGLNNLDDISFSNQYSAICGFTEEEIRKYLWRGVENLARNCETTEGNALELLKKQYDGYHFSGECLDIYNPYSLLKSLKYSEFQNYWIDSGTPTFLINKLEKSGDSYLEIFNEEADSTDLAAIDTAFSSPVALLYQAGYLTIKEYLKKERLYKLGVPNTEVREGFFSVLLSNVVEKDRRKTIRETNKMKDCLSEGNPEEFLQRLQSFLAGVSYKLQSKSPEIYFENNLFVIFTLMGFEVKAEEETSFGRIDLSVKTEKYIYIIEIKVDKSAEKALNQIDNKEYALKYKFDGRKVIKIGINFSAEKRNISSWLISKD